MDNLAHAIATEALFALFWGQRYEDVAGLRDVRRQFLCRL